MFMEQQQVKQFTRYTSCLGQFKRDLSILLDTIVITNITGNMGNLESIAETINVGMDIALTTIFIEMQF